MQGGRGQGGRVAAAEAGLRAMHARGITAKQDSSTRGLTSKQCINPARQPAQQAHSYLVAMDKPSKNVGVSLGRIDGSGLCSGRDTSSLECGPVS